MRVLCVLLGLAACFSLVICDLNKDEGEDCVWNLPDDGEFQGKCVNERRCLTTLDRRGDKPPVCSTKGAATIICCTDCELVNDTSNVIISPKISLLWKDGRKFKDHCLEYLDTLPNKCPGYYGGIARSLGLGEKCHSYSIWGVGGPPPPNQRPPAVNPYEALVGYGEDLETAKWKTSGAIISPKFVLTSGFDAHAGLQLKWVAVGVMDRQDEAHKWQTRKVRSIHVHPQYSAANGRYNYLALLEVETPFEFTRHVFPACLPDPELEIDVSEAKVTPFVDPTTNYSAFENSRRSVTVVKQSIADCSIHFKSLQSTVSQSYIHALPHGLDVTSQACYRIPNMYPTALGSPIVVDTYLDECINTVVAIKIFQEGSEVAVFANTAAYVPWIESVVWP